MKLVSIELWRRLAHYLFLFGAAGTLVELALLGHTEDRFQWVPLILLSAGILAGGTAALRPTATSVKSFAVVTVLYLPAAAAGLWFHLRSNLEFELEMRPGMAGLELARETLTGAIPALAPGAVAQLGLLALLVCFRHPALSRPDPVTSLSTSQQTDP